MPRRLKQVIALWFALQIVLPFTAPLQTCDLGDLLGTRSHHGTPASSESSTTPTTETEADAMFVSPIESSALRAFSDLAPYDLRVPGRLTEQHDLSPAPEVQRAVLRL
jgi:hypothetical protein